MTPRELVRLREAIAFKRAQLARQSPRPFIPQEPTSRQRAFLDLRCREALYGGAAGGGKSSALLMGALEHVHLKGYAALILRRTFADLALPGAIMDRAHAWLSNTGAKWHDRDKTWTFPSGATLTFGYLETENDKFRYQSAEFQYVAFDELTQFTETQYRYLLSRLRRLMGVEIPIRARGGANPGGVGHKWVKARFVDSKDPERTFIPAALADNPHLDQAEYRQTLELLDETTRKQLLEGQWIQDTGGLVYKFDSARNLIEELPKGAYTWALGLDFGIVDQNALTVAGWRANDPCVYIPKSYRVSGSDDVVAGEIKALEAEFGVFSQIVGDLGGLGKKFGEDLAARHSIPVAMAKKADKLGGIRLMNGDFERGRVKLVRSGCEDLIGEYGEVPWNESRTKEAEGIVCDASDSGLYVYRALPAYHERALQPPETVEQRHRREEDEAVARAEEQLERQESLAWWET